MFNHISALLVILIESDALIIDRPNISEMVHDRHNYSGRLIGDHLWPIE